MFRFSAKKVFFLLLAVLTMNTLADVLNVQRFETYRGSISDQALDVLKTIEQYGTSEENNDWSTYIEAQPGNRRFVGKIYFQLDATQQLKAWQKLSLTTNILSPAKREQRWDFHIRDYENGRWIKMGDNQQAQSWVWHKQTMEIKNGIQRFISKNGVVLIRYRSNNDIDVSDIDFLQIKLEENNATLPTPEPTPIPTSVPTPVPTPTPTPTPSPTPTPEPTPSPDMLKDIPLQSVIDKVQPMTGIVLWADSYNESVLKTTNEYTQLEYAYMRPSDIVSGKNQYNWAVLEDLLDDIASRGKQAIIRWYYVYPGKTVSAVPNYIKNDRSYQETIELSEGQKTAFPDWSHPELKQAHLDFYTAFANRYDNDPRIAFLQVGFGLWGEYHIYEPGIRFGENYPDREYQRTFAYHLANAFEILPWSISIDAGDFENSPYSADSQMLALNFGLFDDSFMHEEHSDYNESMWNVFDYQVRFAHSPHGGELSYYSTFDQKHALDSLGMYGRTYEELSSKFHISYMIGNDQPNYQTIQRIKEAGMANGYKFRITDFKASSSEARVTVKNEGVAPLYYDAYITVNGVRAGKTLKGLLPGQLLSVSITINAKNTIPELTIESDHILSQQHIQYNADL